MTDKRYRNLTILLILTLTVLRLIYIRYVPLDLSPDEARYWDWSRRPLQACYLTKPPMVAYIIHLFTSLGTSTTFFVRLGSCVCMALTSLIAYLFASRLFSSARLAFLTVLTLNLAPVFNVGSLIMTIDPPAVLFWTLTCYFTYLALTRSPRFWYLAGLALGLGLLSKFVLIFLLISIALYLLCVKPARQALRRKEPYLALLLILLIYTPLLMWNARNGWCYFEHVFFGHSPSVDRCPCRYLVEFILSQLAIVSPVLFLGLIFALVSALRRRTPELLFLFFCSLPVFLFYLLLSLNQKVQSNWPIAAYITAAVAFVAACAGSPAVWRTRFFRSALAVAACFSLFIYVVPFLNIPRKLDPTFRLRGWKELGQEVSRLIKDTPASAQQPFILSDSHKVTAELAFYVPGQPVVHHINLEGKGKPRQYDFWADFAGLAGRDALYVSSSSRPLPPTVAAAFASCGQSPLIFHYRRGDLTHTFYIYTCRRFKGRF